MNKKINLCILLRLLGVALRLMCINNMTNILYGWKRYGFWVYVLSISYGENWRVCADKEISGTKLSYGSVDYRHYLCWTAMNGYGSWPRAGSYWVRFLFLIRHKYVILMYRRNKKLVYFYCNNMNKQLTF